MTEWIPCEERLPEESGSYLVLLKNGIVIQSWFEIEAVNCFLEPDKVNLELKPFHKHVTHWAPLPEMPKKKRWRPEKGELVYSIKSNGKVWSGDWCNIEEDNNTRDFLGIYKTFSDAFSMTQKIKKFVESEIGEP